MSITEQELPQVKELAKAIEAAGGIDALLSVVNAINGPQSKENGADDWQPFDGGAEHPFDAISAELRRQNLPTLARSMVAYHGGGEKGEALALLREIEQAGPIYMDGDYRTIEALAKHHGIATKTVVDYRGQPPHNLLNTFYGVTLPGDGN